MSKTEQTYKLTKKQKKVRTRIVIAGILFLLFALLPLHGWLKFFLYLVPYGIIGWDVLKKAALNIKQGQVFDENFLMALATVGAFGCGETAEAVAVMLFYQIGELFQSVAVHRSRSSIAALMDIRPDHANVERNGTLIEVDPSQVSSGEQIVVKPGERVPLDGIVLDGSSQLDTSALTGESYQRNVQPGQEIVSGCINLTGVLRIQVTNSYETSTVSKILELVENASSKKAKMEQFITKFARYYTPVVVVSALFLAFLPPLLGFGPVLMWVQRSLNFLVVSCPCALVISVPLAFFGGIGGASRNGILIKGGNYLEALSHVKTMVFDKTGTLTLGHFSVSQLYPSACSSEELVELTALAEQFSPHPIAQAILQHYGKPPDANRVSHVQELAGLGIQAVVDGKTVLVGNLSLMQQHQIEATSLKNPLGSAVYVAQDGQFLGSLVVEDQIKPQAKEELRQLKEQGISKLVMLTGDGASIADKVSSYLGFDEVHSQLLPQDKVSCVETLLHSKQDGQLLAFVGDGINDAPVLSRSDVGIAMGAMGSDAAIEAADVVLMDDSLSALPKALAIAKKTMRIVRQNIVFALGIKLLVLALSIFGYANLWLAVFADVGVSVLAILNSARLLYQSSRK